jgi:hypothetical protein
MKKVFGRIIGGFLAVAGMMAAHTLYLYTHRLYGPKDFYHPFILGLKTSISPDEGAKNEARQALNQKYTYLSYGGQMTVFESEDHRYVMKFFNPRSVIKEGWFHEWSKLKRMNSLKWIIYTHFQRETRLQKYFKRYEMAFKDLREETGVVYVHLDPTTCLSQNLEIVDREGKSHRLSLDNYPFVLQKKVELTMTHIGRLLGEGKTEQARAAVKQIYDLFYSRAKKGYTDRLQTLHKNYGFIDGHAVQLDVGRIRFDEKIEAQPLKDVERIVSNVMPSLAGPFPELAPVLLDCLQQGKDQ